MTTYWTWRLVFLGEVVLVAGILVLTRRIKDVPPEGTFKLDYVGILLSASGLGAAVYGVLKSGEWGWVLPKPGAPSWLGLSPSLWFVLTGVVVVRIFFAWERHMMAHGREPLVNMDLLANSRLVGGHQRVPTLRLRS